MKRLKAGTKCPWSKGMNYNWRKKVRFYVATVGAYWCRNCDKYNGREGDEILCDT